MTAARRSAAAGALAALASLSFASAASAQVVPALGSPDSPGASANAAAAATPNGSKAMASAGTTGGVSTGNGTGATPAGLPQVFPPTLPALSPEHALAARERRNVAAATRWRRRPARPRMGADGVLHFVHGDGEPTVVCAPYRVCDISLEPGETITDKPDIGDPRWTTHPRISGTAASRTLHIIVKPSDAGLDANMLVQTERRTVSVRLVSRTSDYMPFVKLDMPDSASSEESAAWAGVVTGGGAATLARASAGASTPCDAVPVIPPDAYRLGRGNVAWRPTQVYAVSTPVGMKTCVEFRADISSMDVPVLVALDSSGSEQVVSYRQQGRRLLVDRLLDHAELVAGVGGSQDRVTIDRRGYR